MHNELPQGPQPPMSEAEYLEQVAHDMPGGKPPSRIKAMLLLGAGAAILFALLIVFRSMGLV